MVRLFKKSNKPIGTAPGALIHVGEQKVKQVTTSLLHYSPEHLTEKEPAAITEFSQFQNQDGISWFNINGIHDVNYIGQLGENNSIHPLTLEDIVNTRQRPKIEDYEDYLYLVFKMLSFDNQTEVIKSEQISLIVGDGFVISIQEVEGDLFNPVRERIRRGKGRIRKAGCSYLAYALIDAVVDHYFVILENLGEKIEGLEQDLMDNPSESLLESIHRLKREMILFRKQVWPMREMVNRLIKTESPLIHDSTGIFYSDVYDHVVQVTDTIESFRDILSGMLDLYLSTISNRMNEVMKMLTIMATIFIPLTFIAGIYGMNFEFMPELRMKYGYFIALGVMAAMGAGMVIYFKNKKWL
jgi:magnesium transporter